MDGKRGDDGMAVSCNSWIMVELVFNVLQIHEKMADRRRKFVWKCEEPTPEGRLGTTREMVQGPVEVGV